MNEHIKNQLEIMTQQIKELTAVYHSAASKFGISNNEFWIWYALIMLDGECSQQDICDMWSLPKQTVNSVVTGLVKKGYLILEAVPGTRNRKIIRLSEAGKSYVENTVTHIYHAEQRTLGKLSEEERLACISTLGKYINILKGEINEE